MYLDTKKNIEIDIDELYDISDFKQVVYEPIKKVFYMVFNTLNEELGFYVLRIDEKNPENGKFLIKWKSKLNISDVNINLFENDGLKELIISWKVIFINTYNLVSMDISSENSKSLLFWYESIQLWESDCMGFILKNHMDFIHLTKNGMYVCFLGS